MSLCVGFAVLVESTRLFPTLILCAVVSGWWIKRHGRGGQAQKLLAATGLFTILLCFSLFLWSFGERPPLREWMNFSYECAPSP